MVNHQGPKSAVTEEDIKAKNMNKMCEQNDQTMDDYEDH
jgi:hypothetical protein